MRRKVSISTAVVIMLMGALLVFQVTYNGIKNKYQSIIDGIGVSTSTFEKLAEVDALVRNSYINPIDENELQNITIKGYITGLNDKYARYLTKEEFAKYNEEQSGIAYGIGLRIAYNKATDEVSVFSIFSGSPAQNAGIQIGDILYKVNNEYVKDIGFYNAIDRISGEVGTSVTLTVLRGVEEITFTLERAELKIESISYEMLPDNIGYILIYTFDDLTADQFKEAVNNLINQGAKALVFDVRSNGGGRLNTVVSMLDFLLPSGPIIRTTDKNGTERVISSGGESVDLPMAVLINENSASASELFASALKDYNKAVLVGQKSYGKGTVQTVFTLSDSSAIIISTSKFSPPFSDNFEGIGITPDIEASLEADDNFYLISHEQDTQLEAAVSSLKEKIITNTNTVAETEVEIRGDENEK